MPVSGWVNYSISVQVWKSRKTWAGAVTEQTWMCTQSSQPSRQMQGSACAQASVGMRPFPEKRTPDPGDEPRPKSHCANPECNAGFKRLGQGTLFICPSDPEVATLAPMSLRLKQTDMTSPKLTGRLSLICLFRRQPREPPGVCYFYRTFAFIAYQSTVC